MEGGKTDHWLGTDQIGRDLLSRMIYGGRVSLLIGVAAVLVSSTIGVLLGLAAGYLGSRTDRITLTALNLTLTFPIALLVRPASPRPRPRHLHPVIDLPLAGLP